MRGSTVVLAVGISLLISEGAIPNPIVYNVINEVQVSPADRIELHWTPQVPFGFSTPLVWFRIQTNAGTYIITEEGILLEGSYVVIDSTNTEGIEGTTGTLHLDDEEDTLRIWYKDEEYPRLIWPDRVLAPPTGESVAYYCKGFHLPPGCGMSFDYFNFHYTDPTPTFGASNDDTTGSISGKVMDSNGNPVVGALIKTAFIDSVCWYYRYRQAHSDGNGAYSMDLYVAKYWLEASADGFAPESVQVHVAASETSGVDFVLRPLAGIGECSDFSGSGRFSLSPNYPNPFNPTTQIEYALPQETQVSLVIYNLLGQTVATLVNEVQPAGSKIVRWDGRDDGGHVVATGVYLCRLSAGAFVATMKLLLVR